ncbi:MAG: hypothetical protein ACKO1F_09040 [Flammeovirgaceae bacterium]
MRIFILFFFLTTINVNGQDKSFVELNNGEKIESDNILVKEPAFSKAYLLVNGTEKYSLDDVTAYQIKGSYFKKFQISNFAKPTFFFRSSHGKIDAYSKASTTMMVNQSTGSMSTISNRWDYYSINNGPLQKVRYRFLKNDLKDSPKAKEVIRKIKGIRTLTGVFYVAGAGLLISGVADLSNTKGVPPTIIVGAVMYNVNFILLNSKRNMLIDAIDANNLEMK